jgi:hypothetical protein
VAQLISEIWAGLREAGLPEVMLFLPDNSASRCHWDDTAEIDGVRVALLADQDRKIVRILPVDSCTGIGVASPKGVDPTGYKSVVQGKLKRQFGGEAYDEASAGESVAVDQPAEEVPIPLPAWATPPPPPEPPPAPAPVAKADPLTSRWGMAMKNGARPAAGGTGNGRF